MMMMMVMINLELGRYNFIPNAKLTSLRGLRENLETIA